MRNHLIHICVVTLVFLVTFCGALWLVDPYRIFHKPWVRDNYYGGNIRILASGIINTEVFSSIILGTSMAENFSPAEASNVFESKFVNISLSGSSIAERSLVLNHALEKRKLNEVVYSLDLFAFEADSTVNSPIAPYAYLYDNNAWNDILIYVSNLKTIRFAFCKNMLISSDILCSNTRGLENLVEWHSNQEHSKRFGGLHKWLEAKNNAQVQDALKSISKGINTIASGKVKAIDLVKVADSRLKHQQVFRANLLNAIAKYPETKFYLFFPPYSRLNYAITKQSNPQEFENYLAILRLVVNECAQYSNVKVFGFETESFLDDIANYKDTSHYHQQFNSKMLYWMKEGKHELTPSNLDGYIATITGLAANYPLQKIGSQIDGYLQQVPNPSQH